MQKARPWEQQAHAGHPPYSTTPLFDCCRLASELRFEGVPVKRIVVNQVLREGTKEAFLSQKRADQSRAL